MDRLSLTASTAAALLAFAFPVAASTVTQQASDVFNGNGSAGATITYNGSSRGVQAGGFALDSADLGGNFVGWCLDILHNLTLASNYEVTTQPFLGVLIPDSVLDNIEALFNTAYAGLTLSDDGQSAGFQLALWELLYETDTQFDVTQGIFHASSSTAAINAATGFLAGLGGPVTGNYNLTYLQSADRRVRSQNLVSASAVPLPAAGLLLLAAIGGLGVTRRRKGIAA
jgi:hypothetical protein